jgi:malonyl CoA-acyl carrier protein transacylase
MSHNGEERIAVLFPGQGSSVADVRAIVEAHCADLYDLSCGLLGGDPFERASEGTRFAQPAIFLASIAGWRSLAGSLKPFAFAGHSLGEISALTAAGVFETEDALRLIILRAALMADAACVGEPGGMLAVLKGEPGQAEALADACGVVVANDNAPGQSVLSGTRERLREAAQQAREQGLRAIALDVSGAFHSPVVECASQPFERAVRSLSTAAPEAPVFSGLTAQPFTDVAVQLGAALTNPVRWRETMLALDALGATSFVDVGPDRVLARLAERNLPGRRVAVLEELRVHA